nr:hypothetical protein [Nitrosomonas nitrosa]
MIFAIIEDHFEQPMGCFKLVSRQKDRPTATDEQRSLVAVANALDIAVGCA